MKLNLPTFALAVLFLTAAPALATPEEDRATVAELDLHYQAAVKSNDAGTMGRILADDFILVLGDGTVITREELLGDARNGGIVYERQDEVPGTQTVRLFGDTAIVTALLELRGTQAGRRFDRRLWFSDTYVRTPTGWRYAFGQASLPLPATGSGAATVPATSPGAR